MRLIYPVRKHWTHSLKHTYTLENMCRQTTLRIKLFFRFVSISMVQKSSKLTLSALDLFFLAPCAHVCVGSVLFFSLLVRTFISRLFATQPIHRNYAWYLRFFPLLIASRHFFSLHFHSFVHVFGRKVFVIHIDGSIKCFRMTQKKISKRKSMGLFCVCLFVCRLLLSIAVHLVAKLIPELIYVYITIHHQIIDRTGPDQTKET